MLANNKMETDRSKNNISYVFKVLNIELESKPMKDYNKASSMQLRAISLGYENLLVLSKLT
jgi:hypothetical protein